MDFAKLNPWNWFGKEETPEQDLPTRKDHPGQELEQVQPLISLHDRMDQLFDETFRGFGFGFPRSTIAFRQQHRRTSKAAS